MFRRTREIWYSLFAIVLVTALYLVAYRQRTSLPAASSLVGHGIGILGIALMLMTETLYSIRKRVHGAGWGSTAAWLRFHIFTGLVGPYMVLLHSAMSFRGLAGVSMLLTAVVVASGVVGRYVFTTASHASAPADMPAAPSAADPPERPQRSPRARSSLAVWRSVHVPLTWVLFATAFVHAGAALYYSTFQR